MLPLVAALLLGPAAQQRPVFPAQVQAVHLDVFVGHRGQPVEGLTARDFDVRDDGVRQRVELLDAHLLPLRVLLVLDTSGSLGRHRLRELSGAAVSLAAALGPADEAELLPFDHELSLLPVADAEAVGRALKRLRPSGGTALWDAVFAGLLWAGPERSLVVVLTDGADNMSWLDGRDVLEVARRSSAVLQGVAIGGENPESRSSYLRTLRRACEATGGHLWTAPHAEDLQATFARILEAMQHRYLLRFEPSDQRPGWHEIEVRVRGAKGSVKARPGYFLTSPER